MMETEGLIESGRASGAGATARHAESPGFIGGRPREIITAGSCDSHSACGVQYANDAQASIPCGTAGTIVNIYFNIIAVFIERYLECRESATAVARTHRTVRPEKRNAVI
jgi:hypothetical protein